jgi:hypothetical protein
MKTEQEILERIEHIKTLSNGYGINERRIKELEWVLKPSKLSQYDVSGSLDLDLLEKKLDEALEKETPESLDKWLKDKRQ